MNIYKENYKFLLSLPQWRRKRLEIINRDKVCQKCGTDRILVVHHTTYITGHLPWQYDNELLITLCKDCHNKEHEDLTDLHRLIDEMLISNMWAYEIKQMIEHFRSFS